MKAFVTILLAFCSLTLLTLQAQAQAQDNQTGCYSRVTQDDSGNVTYHLYETDISLNADMTKNHTEYSNLKRFCSDAKKTCQNFEEIERCQGQ